VKTLRGRSKNWSLYLHTVQTLRGWSNIWPIISIQCKRQEAETRTEHSSTYSANVERMKKKLITISPYSTNVKRLKQKPNTHLHRVQMSSGWRKNWPLISIQCKRLTAEAKTNYSSPHSANVKRLKQNLTNHLHTVQTLRGRSKSWTIISIQCKRLEAEAKADQSSPYSANV